MKIAVITCYDQVEVHARARVLRAAFAAVPGVQAIIVKNRHKGLLRYLEVPLRIIWTRLRQRPDAYVITFRGYEMLPLVLLIKGRKPLVFDELINAAEYLHEHQRLKPGSRPDKLFRTVYGWLLRRCQIILADTDAHADYSSQLCNVERSRYTTIPISVEENMFHPKKTQAPKHFTVFYYGVMSPLHGLQYVIDAAVALADNPHITFVLGGDQHKSWPAYKAAIAKGARIAYHPWFPYEELPDCMRSSSLCLGGPFGNTLQSQFVITTKTFQMLACEMPVLVGRNKVNEGFVDKKNCLSVPPADAQALADAVLWAANHPRQLQQIARRGRTLYEQHFSQAHITHKIQQLTQRLKS